MKLVSTESKVPMIEVSELQRQQCFGCLDNEVGNGRNESRILERIEYLHHSDSGDQHMVNIYMRDAINNL